jgi:hypothetical protein
MEQGIKSQTCEWTMGLKWLGSIACDMGVVWGVSRASMGQYGPVWASMIIVEVSVRNRKKDVCGTPSKQASPTGLQDGGSQLYMY